MASVRAVAPLRSTLRSVAVRLGLAAAAGGVLAFPALSAQVPPGSPPPVRIVVRNAADAAAPDELLDGRTIAGEVLVSVVPAELIRSARFHLDDPALAAPRRIEKKPPFDLEGGSARAPNPWDTRGVADGPHELAVVVSLAGGGEVRLLARFTVANLPPVLRFEAESLRIHARAGEGAALEREVGLDGAEGARFAIGDPPPWLAVEPRSGSLPATIRLRVDATGLAPGEHAGTILVRGDGGDEDLLGLALRVHGPEQAFARSVERHGIRWELADEAPAGTFANGDPWLLGPVRIESVSPEWDGALHGSMVNPRYGAEHGYDVRFNFDERLRAGFPRDAFPGESIVSTRGWRADEPGAPSSENTLGIPRPALRTAAVLTVLAEPPPAGAFRPPYAGAEKPIRLVSELRLEALPALEPVAGAPRPRELLPRYERLWLDHTAKWENRFLHPSESMSDYCRDLARDFNDGSLVLLLDLPPEEKRALAISLVQIGIDMYAVLETGATWGDGGGGFGSGRKWAILLAGILLDDPGMKGIGARYGPEIALEDCQTFYLTEEEREHYPGVPLGHPVWGERFCRPRSNYRNPGKEAYRTCCTATAWVGAVLSAHILGARALWDHEPLFDYQDWYMATEAPGSRQRGISPFAEAMWDRYRAAYGPVWTGE